MVRIPAKWILLLIVSNLAFRVVRSANYQSAKKTYIVKMDNSAMPESFSSHVEWYTSKVKSIVSEPETSKSFSAEVEDRILYHYQNVFHGFAAQLTEEEVNKLEQEGGFLVTFPETKYELHTTRTPSFLGLEGTKSDWPVTDADGDVIVGVIDSGVWPKSESFNDIGMNSVPSRWKGTCETGSGFNKHDCNKKLIGARVFSKGQDAAVGKNYEYMSPIDESGHGTHIATTAVGSRVQNASFFGYAYGKARGMAPDARVAVYRVCSHGCLGSDILAGMEAAIVDGVDVLSISLGGELSYLDEVAVASYHAMERGVFVSCSGGNDGPEPSTIDNVAPWIATVGASTIDRGFRSIVKLGSKSEFAGLSLYSGKKVSGNKQYPLVYLGSSNLDNQNSSSLCIKGALNPHVVKGKIIICATGELEGAEKAQVVKEAGGIGMILINTPSDREDVSLELYDFPTVAVGAKEGKEIVKYALTSPDAIASLAFLTQLGVKPAPVVAAFSSRGPNGLSPEIMKPDVIAPGVDILASWPDNVPPADFPYEKRRVNFNIISGTSMACPHVSGIAAWLKAKHPDWSPAAIKSALMTTAYIHDNTNHILKDGSTSAPANPYAYGAGHIYPTGAVDPGLVYDIEPQDYFEFLCTQNLTTKQLRVFSNRTCHHSLVSPSDLNYPTISVIFPGDKSVSSVTVHRTVTNVAPEISNYHVSITSFKSASVTIEPKTLKFTRPYQKLSYKITFKSKKKQVDPEFGDLIWKDGKHVVRSSILLKWQEPK